MSDVQRRHDPVLWDYLERAEYNDLFRLPGETKSEFDRRIARLRKEFESDD